MTRVSRKEAAEEAAHTRWVRGNFRRHFGHHTLAELQCITDGDTQWDDRSRAAIKAHLTRGTYFPYVYRDKKTGNISGFCNL